MSATSPAPWTVNNSGGAMTIVARDRSVVAVVMGSGAAAPFESSNAALMVASPDLRDALREYVDLSDVSLDSLERVASEFYEATGFLAPGKDIPAAVDSDAYREERRQRWNEWTRAKDAARLARARAALAKAEASR